MGRAHRLTLRQFFALWAQVPGPWRLVPPPLDWEGAAGRQMVRQRGRTCPVVAVAKHLKVSGWRQLRHDDYAGAARALGLSPRDAARLADAADDRPSADQTAQIRRRFLERARV